MSWRSTTLESSDPTHLALVLRYALEGLHYLEQVLDQGWSSTLQGGRSVGAGLGSPVESTMFWNFNNVHIVKMF